MHEHVNVSNCQYTNLCFLDKIKLSFSKWRTCRCLVSKTLNELNKQRHRIIVKDHKCLLIQGCLILSVSSLEVAPSHWNRGQMNRGRQGGGRLCGGFHEAPLFLEGRVFLGLLVSHRPPSRLVRRHLPGTDSDDWRANKGKRTGKLHYGEDVLPWFQVFHWYQEVPENNKRVRRSFDMFNFCIFFFSFGAKLVHRLQSACMYPLSRFSFGPSDTAAH